MTQGDSLCVRITDLNAGPETPVPWLLMRGGQCALQGVDAPRALAERFRGERQPPVRVLVPGKCVVLTQVNIPTQQAKLIRRAMPYLVEELLAEDIHEVHIARAPETGGDGRYEIGVVRHLDLIHWLDTLFGAGLKPAQLVPDVLAVPMLAQWNLLVEPGGVLLRTGEFQGICTSTENAAQVLELALRDADPKPASATLQSGQDDASLQLASELEALFARHGIADVECISYREPCDEALLATLGRAGNRVFNMLQGGYSSQRGDAQRFRPLPVAAAACVCALAFTALAYGAGGWLAARAEAARADSIALYRSLYPDEKRVVNPRVQMERHLQAAPSGDTQVLGQLLQAMASAFSQHPDFRVQQLRIATRSEHSTSGLRAARWRHCSNSVRPSHAMASRPVFFPHSSRPMASMPRSRSR